MTDRPSSRRGPVLFLTTSLLTDRMLAYSDAVEDLADLGVEIWAQSMGTENGARIWADVPVPVSDIPKVDPLRYSTSGFLRRIDERAWEARLRPPSRVVPKRDGLTQPGSDLDWLFVPAGKAIAKLGQHERFEAAVGRHLMRASSSPDGEAALRRLDPSAVVIMNPFWGASPDLGAIALRLGIPTLGLIPSWDNVSTKRRMELPYDGYLVWSERGERELHEFYPNRAGAPVRRTGAVQFDVFFQDRFREPRAAWLERNGLHPDRPVIVYALASPNFLDEVPGALAMAKRVAAGDLGEVTMLVRSHPIHDEGEMARHFSAFGPSVVFQRPPDAPHERAKRSQSADVVLEWVSTFRHADVVINMASTVTVDASVCDTPVISLDYDPSPGGRLGPLIHDINHSWTHFAPVARSGGVRMVEDEAALVEATRSYLADPSQDREGRQRIVADVCGVADGHCGARLAAGVRELVEVISKDRAP